jgi:hypothetical protein
MKPPEKSGGSGKIENGELPDGCAATFFERRWPYGDCVHSCNGHCSLNRYTRKQKYEKITAPV